MRPRLQLKRARRSSARCGTSSGPRRWRRRPRSRSSDEPLEEAGEPDPGAIEWDDDGANDALAAALEKAKADLATPLDGPAAEAARAARAPASSRASHVIGLEAAKLAKSLSSKPTSGPGSRAA
jgi:hypothetical protein